MRKPKVLICNDDGIDAPGIHALWRSIKDHFDATICAPAEDQSCKGVGISLPKSRHIEAEKVHWEEGITAWRVFGTPADCTKFALHYLMKEHPDMILSGHNNGSNAGRNALYSGTIGAVIQGTVENIPGIAFSCMYDDGPEKFERAAPFVPNIAQHFLKHPLPKGTVLNVNFPSTETDGIVGIKMATQGKSYWDSRIISDASLKNTKLFPMLDGWDYHDESLDSDIHLLQEGYITIVPLHAEDLTHHEYKKSSEKAFEKLTASFNFG